MLVGRGLGSRAPGDGGCLKVEDRAGARAGAGLRHSWSQSHMAGARRKSVPDARGSSEGAAAITARQRWPLRRPGAPASLAVPPGGSLVTRVRF